MCRIFITPCPRWNWPVGWWITALLTGFFCNSGAEANEAAIKLARKYFYDRSQPGRFRVVAMQQSFHGRTMGTLSATGQEKIRKGFAPVLEKFEFVPFGDLGALEGTRNL